MVVRFRKKVRKQRGSHTHGYGSKKKHRGGGSRGGRGYGGSHKHKYSRIVAYERNHFGYKGFHSLKKKGKTINLDELDKMIGNKNEIDLSKLGYNKLLSRGNISKSIIVKIKKFSKKAKEKIEKAGGKIVE
jgi:large subunit ribosomal protein L15